MAFLEMLFLITISLQAHKPESTYYPTNIGIPKGTRSVATLVVV